MSLAQRINTFPKRLLVSSLLGAPVCAPIVMLEAGLIFGWQDLASQPFAWLKAGAFFGAYMGIPASLRWHMIARRREQAVPFV